MEVRGKALEFGAAHSRLAEPNRLRIDLLLSSLTNFYSLI
jgi:hypothetical protein